MASDKEKPATGSSRGGSSRGVSGQGRRNDNPHRPMEQFTLSFRSPPDGPKQTVTGRVAQTLTLLVQTGPKGFTSGEASPLGWARRTSHYILKLRELGLEILTVWEKAGDCRIGRYVLLTPVVVIAAGDAK